jgi:hypothetical protein
MHDSGETSATPLAALAGLFDRLGRHEVAATIAGFAISPFTAVAITEINTAITHLRDVLGDQTYEALARKGETMTIAEAVTYACTMMLVALGDKPARRARTVTSSTGTQTPAKQRLAQPPTQNAKAEFTPLAPTSARAQTSASVQPDPAQTAQGSAHTKAKPVDAESAQVDAILASELIASGVTTQPVETVIAVLAAMRDGASMNAAAKASGINYRTAQRIVEAATERQQRQLVAVR